MRRHIISDLIEELAFRTGRGYARIRAKRVKDAEKLGADFGGQVFQEEMGYDPSEGNDYTASWGYVRRLFYRVGKNDVIMDLGCGKGYAMYLMGNAKFKIIYGIEKSKMLCDIANKNISTIFKGDDRFKVWCVDATKLLETDEVKEAFRQSNYFYIFNSFPYPVMEKVVKEFKVLVEEKREFTIWYSMPTPECLDIIMNDPDFKLNRHLFKNRPGAGVYEFVSVVSKN